MGGVKIHSKYKPLFTSKKRYFCLTGGRASLKSTTVHDFISRLTFEAGHGVLMTRYTMTSAEKSIIPEFEAAIKRNGTFNYFHKAGTKYTNTKTGSFVIFSGIKTSSGDQTANLKSLSGITTWVIEEGEDFTDEKAFDEIDDSIRTAGMQNRVIWIQNPSTREHFIYKRWIEKTPAEVEVEGHKVTVSGHPDVEAIHTTYHVAKELDYLSDSFISKVERTKEEQPKRYYHKYIGGWLEKADGVAFPNWVRGKFDDSVPYLFGIDFGANDEFTISKFGFNNKEKKIHVKNYVYESGLNTDDIKSRVTEHIPIEELTVVDCADKTKRLDLLNWGFNAYPSYKGKIKDRVQDMQAYQIVVDDSPHMEVELNNYAVVNGKLIDKFNHIIDPMGYCWNYYKRNMLNLQ